MLLHMISSVVVNILVDNCKMTTQKRTNEHSLESFFFFYVVCCFFFHFGIFTNLYHVSVKYLQVCLLGRHVQTKNLHDLK